MNDEFGAGMPSDDDPFAELQRHLLPDDKLRLLVFLFRLPRPLPVVNRDSWSFAVDGDLGEKWDIEAMSLPTEAFKEGPLTNLRRPLASIMTWQPLRGSKAKILDLTAVAKVARSIFPNFDPNPFEPITLEQEEHDTVVEVVTQAARADTEPMDWPLVSVCFERALKTVNELIAAIGAGTGDAKIAPVSVEELDDAALVGSRPIFEGADVAPVVYPLYLRVPPPIEVMDQPTLSKVAAWIRAGRQRHPFLVYERLYRDARRARDGGGYAEAAVLAAVAGEVLLNTVLRGMMVEENRAEEIAVTFSDPRGGFAARLKREYAARLGGTWNVDDPTTALGHWVVEPQGLRHRVLHSGYTPSAGEASEALHGAELLERFVMGRLAACRYKYPKTVLSTIGEAGLERRDLLNRRMRLIADRSVPTLPEYWEAMG